MTMAMIICGIIILFSAWVWHLKQELVELHKQVLALPKGAIDLKEVPAKKPLKQWEQAVPTWKID